MNSPWASIATPNQQNRKSVMAITEARRCRCYIAFVKIVQARSSYNDHPKQQL
jgi:hypothetical protein